MNIDLEYIKTLVKLASENELTELKITSGDNKIIIKKEKETHVAHAIPSLALPAAGIAPAVEAASTVTDQLSQTVEGTKEIKPTPTHKGEPVVSPMVGTFYRAPSPDSPPFVDVGQKVEVGQVLCIIESMKLMNEIESDIAGVVREICVENSDAVEAGTVLMYIE